MLVRVSVDYEQLDRERRRNQDDLRGTELFRLNELEEF